MPNQAAGEKSEYAPEKIRGARGSRYVRQPVDGQQGKTQQQGNCRAGIQQAGATPALRGSAKHVQKRQNKSPRLAREKKEKNCPDHISRMEPEPGAVGPFAVAPKQNKKEDQAINGKRHGTDRRPLDWKIG